MPQRTEPSGFDAAILPHMDAAYNLARWMLRNPDDAEEVVQDAALRAFVHYASCRGTNPRAWLLQIVRNVALARLRSQHQVALVPLYRDDDEPGESFEPADPADGPETVMLRGEELREVDRLLTKLPLDLRETIVLRELEELSYKDMARVTGVPLGTVMSRLWRARKRLERRAMKAA